VQWCHGAPGLVPTMLKAEEALGGGGRYLRAARRAAAAIWERGLLTKVRSALCGGSWDRADERGNEAARLHALGELQGALLSCPCARPLASLCLNSGCMSHAPHACTRARAAATPSATPQRRRASASATGSGAWGRASAVLRGGLRACARRERQLHTCVHARRPASPFRLRTETTQARARGSAVPRPPRETAPSIAMTAWCRRRRRHLLRQRQRLRVSVAVPRHRGAAVPQNGTGEGGRPAARRRPDADR
jgi:hypothetical protein